MDGLAASGVTAEQFIEWSLQQPKGQRYELSDGRIVQMASERLRHALTKHLVLRRLEEAIERHGLNCQAYPDGMAVRVTDSTVYEPDAAVRCGAPLDMDTVIYSDPIIVVEVTSPSTKSLDSAMKLAGYFDLPSVQHYLIVDPARPCVIHHARNGDRLATQILTAGPLLLDPPGITLDVASLFPVESGTGQQA